MTTEQVPTTQEILERINARKPDDMFGFEWLEYVLRLPFDDAKPFLKADATDDGWKGPQSREAIIETMRDYMQFAWGKANDCRGISANRSVMHYIAWTWLAGDREFSGEIQRMFEQDYHHYGKPILETICEHYGWDWKQWDDGVRTNGE